MDGGETGTEKVFGTGGANASVLPPEIAPADDPSSVTIHDASGTLLALLDQLGCSLLLSTDDSRLITIGVQARQPTLRAVVLPLLRGVAMQGRYLAVGTADSVLVLKDVPGLAPVAPDAPKTFDAIYAPRAIHFTGVCDFHDMAFVGGAVTAVNTRYSCLCAVDGQLSFTPLWKPPFISQLRPEDRCHLNGMAVAGNQIRYVTLLAQSDEPHGWRHRFMDNAGLVLEVPSGRVVARGLSLPHSPRVFDGKLYCLESGRGHLLGIEPSSGAFTVLAKLPGFPHGMVLHQGVLFISVSQLRRRRPERPLPLEQEGVEPICGVVALDAATCAVLGTLEIRSGIHEIYDLQILPNVRHADIRAPALAGLHHAIELPDVSFWATETRQDAGDDPARDET